MYDPKTGIWIDTNERKYEFETAYYLKYNLEKAKFAIEKIYSKDINFQEYSNKVVVSSSGVEWLCKNVFKQKYLELLEKYKMELTELYIESGYPYDNFFHKN